MPTLIDKIITEDGLFEGQECSRIQFDYYVEELKKNGWKIMSVSRTQVIATNDRAVTTDGRTILRYIALNP